MSWKATPRNQLVYYPIQPQIYSTYIYNYTIIINRWPSYKSTYLLLEGLSCVTALNIFQVDPPNGGRNIGKQATMPSIISLGRLYTILHKPKLRVILGQLPPLTIIPVRENSEVVIIDPDHSLPIACEGGVYHSTNQPTNGNLGHPSLQSRTCCSISGVYVFQM